MASIFTRIINGNIPSRIVWKDNACVVMVDIRPLHPGHCLVIPRVEVDQWTELDVETAQHLMTVAHRVGRTLKELVPCQRVGLMIAGFEVPHTHLHVVPLQSMANLDFTNADEAADPGDLDAIAAQLSAALAD